MPPEPPEKVVKRRPGRQKVRNKGIPPGFKKGMFHPELVGVVTGYAPNLEEWTKRSERCRAQVIRLNAEGRCNRKGIPDGWARRRPLLDAIRNKAAEEAKELVKIMINQGYVGPIEDPRAEEALEDAVSMLRAVDPETGQKVYAPRERLAAQRVLLDFLKVKPVSRVEASVTKAEDWLAMLANPK